MVLRVGRSRVSARREGGLWRTPAAIGEYGASARGGAAVFGSDAEQPLGEPALLFEIPGQRLDLPPQQSRGHRDEHRSIEPKTKTHNSLFIGATGPSEESADESSSVTA